MSEERPLDILVVEDNLTDVFALQNMFDGEAEFSYDLVHVVRLKEAQKKLKEGRFDIILLDLGLPDSQGLSTFEELYREGLGIPILVLTGLNDEEIGLKAVQLGAQDYIVKNQIHSGLLGRVLHYSIERQRNSSQLRHTQERYRLLAARLQKAREDERTRISREIHDELGQQLTGLKMDLRSMNRALKRKPLEKQVEVLRKKIEVATKLADETIETVQRLALELRPGVLDNIGLIGAIRDEVKRFEERTGLSVELDLPENGSKLCEPTSTAFFRILQELLTNILRHSQAQTVEVCFKIGDDDSVLFVRDDGLGFPSLDVVSKPTSLGLLGMSERAEQLGGYVVIESQPGEGTRATVRIPKNPNKTGWSC